MGTTKRKVIGLSKVDIKHLKNELLEIVDEIIEVPMTHKQAEELKDRSADIIQMLLDDKALKEIRSTYRTNV